MEKKWIDSDSLYIYLHQIMDIFDITKKSVLSIKILKDEIREGYERLDKLDIDSNEHFEEWKELQKLNILNSDLSILGIGNIASQAKLIFAIDTEMRINKLCYLMLGEDVEQAIEKLDIENKMIVICKFLNKPFKGEKIHQLLKDIKKTRNIYAHGKIQFINGKMSENIINPSKINEIKNISINEEIKEILKYALNSLYVIEYLKNLNTSSQELYPKIDIENLNFFINEIKKYTNILVNNVSIDDKTLKDLQYHKDRLLLKF